MLNKNTVVEYIYEDVYLYHVFASFVGSDYYAPRNSEPQRTNGRTGFEQHVERYSNRYGKDVLRCMQLDVNYITCRSV